MDQRIYFHKSTGTPYRMASRSAGHCVLVPQLIGGSIRLVTDAELVAQSHFLKMIEEVKGELEK